VRPIEGLSAGLADAAIVGHIRRKKCGEYDLYLAAPGLAQFYLGRTAERLAPLTRAQGRLLGRMEALGFDLRDRARLDVLTADAVIKAALAHFRFVTIHPFDDGNRRIARALADLALARADGSEYRFYSMSAQIRAERAAYYDLLERSQKGSLDVTAWLVWFLDCLARAVAGAEAMLGDVLFKAEFWKRYADAGLNRRQVAVLNRVLDGFEGGITSSKWAKLAKCSQDTALRDIADLAMRGILVRSRSGGRSTAYAVAELPAAR
jgi:Fic family protein